MSEVMFGDQMAKVAGAGKSGDWVGFLRALDTLLKNPVVANIAQKRLGGGQPEVMSNAPPQAPATRIIQNQNRATPAMSGNVAPTKKNQTAAASKVEPAKINDEIVIDHFLKKIKTPEGKLEIAGALEKLKMVTGDKTLSELQTMLKDGEIKK